MIVPPFTRPDKEPCEATLGKLLESRLRFLGLTAPSVSVTRSPDIIGYVIRVYYYTLKDTKPPLKSMWVDKQQLGPPLVVPLDKVTPTWWEHDSELEEFLQAAVNLQQLAEL